MVEISRYIFSDGVANSLVVVAQVAKIGFVPNVSYAGIAGVFYKVWLVPSGEQSSNNYNFEVFTSATN